MSEGWTYFPEVEWWRLDEMDWDKGHDKHHHKDHHWEDDWEDDKWEACLKFKIVGKDTNK